MKSPEDIKDYMESENIVDTMGVNEFLLVCKYKRDGKINIDYIHEKIEDIEKYISIYTKE